MDLVKKRQSCRNYKPDTVPHKKIERCLEAARLAPSASNAQPWYFLVVDEPHLKDAVARTTFGSVVSFNKFTRNTPIMVAVVGERQRLLSKIGSIIKHLAYRQIDIGIAAEHFCLQAAELGLGTCLIGWFNQKKIKKALKLPGGKKVFLLIALGYPARDEKPRKKIRKGISQIRQYNI